MAVTHVLPHELLAPLDHLVVELEVCAGASLDEHAVDLGHRRLQLALCRGRHVGLFCLRCSAKEVTVNASGLVYIGNSG